MFLFRDILFNGKMSYELGLFISYFKKLNTNWDFVLGDKERIAKFQLVSSEENEFFVCFCFVLRKNMSAS